MTQDQWLVLARSLANTAATAAVTAGVLSLSQETSLEAGVEHIENGVKEILIGLGIIVPIVTPIWGVLKARLSSQVTAVHQAAPAALVAAVAAVKPNVLINAVAANPDVAQIVTTTKIADATPSPKVVSK